MASRPVRVLVLGHTYVVGLNQAKLEALASLGSLQVAALVPETWRAGELGHRHRVERRTSRAEVMSEPVWFSGRVGAYLFPPHRVLAAARRTSPDVVHVEAEAFGLVALESALLARVLRVPLVLFCWENLDRRLSPVRRLARRYVLSRAHAIIAGSESAAQTLQRWGFRGRLIVCPQLGVDPRDFVVAGTRRGDAFVIGYAGRLVPEKGVDVLIDALAALRTQGCDVRARIVGAGPAEASLRARAASRGIAELIEWRGAVPHDQVPRELAAMDALVLPSRTAPRWREQFGHVLIQAMAAGVPAVGSSSGAIPEVIGHPRLLFPEGDAPALAGVLQRLIEDAAWRAEAQAWGRARVEERFTHARIAERLGDLYQDLAGVSR